MSPVWNKSLCLKAIQNNQLLIPGINTTINYQEAISIGYKILKIFPAHDLGLDFLGELKASNKSEIFTIAAGGLQIKDVNTWLKKGYGAITLGRKILIKDRIDPTIKNII